MNDALTTSVVGRTKSVVQGVGGLFAFSVKTGAVNISGRGLHSSTYHLNLSRFGSQKPQQASTSQLNMRRFCPRDSPTCPSKNAHVKPKSGHVEPIKRAYVELKSGRV